MQSAEDKKQRIIQLLTLNKNQIQKLSEEQIIQIIDEVEVIKQESVLDKRYLGELTRRRKLSSETLTA